MRALSTVAPIAVASLLWSVGMANSQEWEEISDRQARIVFFADAAGLTKDIGYQGGGESPAKSYEIGYWSSYDALLAIEYGALSGNWTWNRLIKVEEESLLGWEFLSGKRPSLEPAEEMVNVLGEVSYARFDADDWGCFGFVQMFDRGGSRRPEQHQKWFSGAYCDQCAQRIDIDTIEAILKNIGVKGFKEP